MGWYNFGVMCWYQYYWVHAVVNRWVPVLVGKSNGCAGEEFLPNSLAVCHGLGAGEKECIHHLEMDEVALNLLHC